MSLTPERHAMLNVLAARSARTAALAAKIADAEALLDDALGSASTLHGGVSGGKDSSVVMALLLRAARRRCERGEPCAPIEAVAADTLLEPPMVASLRDALFASARRFAALHRIPLTCTVVRPRITERMWPRMLAGRKLPSFPRQRAECSVSLKIAPAMRYLTSLGREYVSVIGSREQESTARKASMAKVRDLPPGCIGMLMPIRTWTHDDVFAALLDKSFFPGHDFGPLVRHYEDGAGVDSCTIGGLMRSNERGGCATARSGCMTCTRVTSDKFLEAHIAADNGWGHLAPMFAIGRHLREVVQFDWTRRHNIGRDLDPVTGAVAIGPNCFSFTTTQELLEALLTADADEVARAGRIAQEIADGVRDDTPENRALAERAFNNLAFEDIVAIDHMRAIDRFGPPFAAIEAWWRIVVEGDRRPLPHYPAVPETPRPPLRYAMPDRDDWLRTLRNVDGLEDALGLVAGLPSPWQADPIDDSISFRDAGTCEALAFDPEALALFFEFEVPDIVAAVRAGSPPAWEPYYRRLGLVQPTSRAAWRLDAQARRAQAMALLGITDDRHDALYATAVSAEEHAALRARFEAAMPAVADEPVPCPVEAPDHLYARLVALRHAIDGGVTRFDGADLGQMMQRVKREFARAERVHGPLNPLRRRAIERLADASRQHALEDGPIDRDAEQLVMRMVPYILLPSLHRRRTARQDDLFSAAA
jgi:3'-phosphoadenosine 5'-phosphosulfate sulfotransferase (PAPS reductase)/FAD synthetase